MQHPAQHPGSPDTPRGRFNRRRLVVLMVVVFIIVVSFFAGRFSGPGSKTYIQLENPASGQAPGSDRTGIPPDSLPH
jgi:hypothetical protein